MNSDPVSPEPRFDADTDIRAALDGAWARSRQTYERRLASLEHAIVALLAGGRTSDESMQVAYEDAHKLTGSLGTFGLTEASRLASELERFWASGRTSVLSELRRASRLTVALRRELTQAFEKQIFATSSGDIVQSAPDDGPSPHSRPDVLIVEDDEVLAALVWNALAASGYEACLFTDGLTAVRSLCGQESIQPRVILLDVELPKLNGFGVLRRLAQSGAAKQSRVIMLTRHATQLDVQHATNLGIFDYVAKPFTLPLLLERVGRALQSAE